MLSYHEKSLLANAFMGSSDENLMTTTSFLGLGLLIRWRDGCYRIVTSGDERQLLTAIKSTPLKPKKMSH